MIENTRMYKIIDIFIGFLHCSNIENSTSIINKEY